tara:strand:+ start:2046 stop:2264 length:219 start_codon:yes stop_codon:yes gene_type:complete
MIIPIKCFTCGKVLADKYLYYKQEIGKKKDANEIIYFTENKLKKTPEANVLDKLQLKKMCCRRHMLTHVDIE